MAGPGPADFFWVSRCPGVHAHKKAHLHTFSPIFLVDFQRLIAVCLSPKSLVQVSTDSIITQNSRKSARRAQHASGFSFRLQLSHQRHQKPHQSYQSPALGSYSADFCMYSRSFSHLTLNSFPWDLACLSSAPCRDASSFLNWAIRSRRSPPNLLSVVFSVLCPRSCARFT